MEWNGSLQFPVFGGSKWIRGIRRELHEMPLYMHMLQHKPHGIFDIFTNCLAISTYCHTILNMQAQQDARVERLIALRSKWTVRVQSLQTQLRVGIYAHEREPQPILVSLRISGLAETSPATLAQCFDYEPICRWVLDEWPLSAHTPLLETRLNELAAQVFAADKRVMDVWVGLYKTQNFPQAQFVGLERDITRLQFEEQQRARIEMPALSAPAVTSRSRAAARVSRRWPAVR